MLQIESLGFTQKLASQLNKVSTSQEKSSFSKLLQSVTAPEEETSNDNKAVGLTATDVTDLLAFLSKDDLLDVEEGLQLLDQVISNSNEDLLTMIENYLGMSHILFQNLLSNVMEKLQIEGGEGQSDLAKLLQVIEKMSNLTVSQLHNVLDKDSLKLVKSAKLYELMTQNQDSLNEDSSKLDFKTLSAKLTSILEGNSLKSDQAASRLAFLKQTFSSISTSNSLKEEPTSTSSTPKADIINGSVQFMQMSRPEQLTVTLQNGTKQVQTEQLIKQFESILARSQFSNVNGVQRLFLQLNPGHLGSLRIEIIQQDSVMVAKIVTSTQAAKEAIEGQLNQLKQAFNSQNIQVERVEISQQTAGQERFLNRDGEQEQARREQAERKEEQTSDQDFISSFEEALLNTEV
ncbi:flagellar hook-length control protein FliK [Robertmurraya korlensis]|uniref:flagellar hook-length control protein FliK n=1 Tax=Robertmurraya korlensis TaxID=519977 RepID=UPI00203CD277|nr:flagellar hook-length control protein FliK [Robertmurraya korlensis]MCM3600186.1 flagellar hook-length control protein FliK [Robertmurraya korlensis]